MSEIEKIYSAEYLANLQKQEEEKKAFAKKQEKINEHAKARRKDIETEENSANPRKLFYEFLMTGAGICVQMAGIFGRNFTVKETAPEYKSVDNVLRYVVFPESGEYYHFTNYKPYNLLKMDNSAGDEYRAIIFEAYKNALKIFKYCREHEIERFNFADTINPDYRTLYDYEVKNFFDTLKK